MGKRAKANALYHAIYVQMPTGINWHFFTLSPCQHVTLSTISRTVMVLRPPGKPPPDSPGAKRASCVGVGGFCRWVSDRPTPAQWFLKAAAAGSRAVRPGLPC